AKEAAAAVEIIGRVDGPNVDVPFFGAGDGGVDVGILQAKAAAAEIINPRRNEEDGVAPAGRRPALEEIENGEVGAGDGAGGADGNAQCFGGEFVVLGEVLGDGGVAVAGVGHGYVGSSRLVEDELLEIGPLIGDGGVERIVDENGEAEVLFAAQV